MVKPEFLSYCFFPFLLAIPVKMGEIVFMNIAQHFFIYIGVILITFMAIMLDSTLLWLVAAISLIGESIWICKNKSLDFRIIFLLFLFIIVFVILFLNSYEIRKGIRSIFPTHRVVRF